MQGCHVTDQQMTLRQTHAVSVAAAKAGIIPTAKKVDTFLAVLCLTAETLRVSPPTGPSLIPRGAFALFSGPLRGPQSRPLYQRT